MCSLFYLASFIRLGIFGLGLRNPFIMTCHHGILLPVFDLQYLKHQSSMVIGLSLVLGVKFKHLQRGIMRVMRNLRWMVSGQLILVPFFNPFKFIQHHPQNPFLKNLEPTLRKIKNCLSFASSVVPSDRPRNLFAYILRHLYSALNHHIDQHHHPTIAKDTRNASQAV